MKLVAALALVVLLPASLSATTIIILRSPDRIVLAGDSRATVASDGAAVRTRDHDCKVRPAGRWWFVAGGFSAARDLDVRAVVREALAPTTTMAAARTALHAVCTARIRPALLSEGAFFYARPERLGTPVLAVYIAGLDGGVPTVGSFGVDVASIQPFTLVSYGATCPGALCPDGRLFLGNSIADEPVLTLLRTLPRPDWLERADAAAARRLIELQADATPERVARPIDVLELTAAGARWIDRDPASSCRAAINATVSLIRDEVTPMRNLPDRVTGKDGKRYPAV